MKVSDIANYYDRNTVKFLRLGVSGSEQAIHRGLWGEGVDSARAAAQYAHRLIEHKVERNLGCEPEQVLDLGCGVGGTLLALAARYPRLRLRGVTISSSQVEWARRFVARAGIAERCEIVQADFHALELGQRFDLVILIESLVHSPIPVEVLREASRHLAPAGMLVVLDDFLVQQPEQLGVPERAALERFRKGWKVPGVTTVESFCAAAEQVGLQVIEEDDLTPLIRTNRFRDRLVAWSAPILERLGGMQRPFAANIIGGDALRQGIQQGWMGYRMFCLQRRTGS
jgi:ubiquinone/menaquinone biosynthesis C-methylase UbiE